MKHALLGLTLMVLGGVSSLPGLDPNPPGTARVYIAVGSSPTFLDAWRRPPVKGKPTAVPLVKEFAIGDTAYVAFIVTGIQPDEGGQANVTVDMKLIKPDGTFMFDMKECSRVQGFASKEPGFVAADPALDITFEPGDPVGKYSLVAVVHDLVSKKAGITEVCIDVHEKRPN